MPEPLPALAGDATADVVVVGGGFTGLWSAWHLAATGAAVVVLEGTRCGFGPSGRNGGFVSSLDLVVDPASALGVAGREAVLAIGEWCSDESVDAWFRPAPHVVVSTAPAQDAAVERRVPGAHIARLDADAVRALCASPTFRIGAAVPCGATVHPARLVFGLRERLLARGVRIFEGSPVRSLRGGRALTASGSVTAGAAIVAAGARSSRFAGARLTVGSSHVVVTEPVPEVIDELGWHGGEAITDARALLHYFRTTRDDRILFGWAGGRMAAGRRGDGVAVDARVIEQVRRDLVRIFPALRGRAIEHAWGGPVDVSPLHLPGIRQLGERSFAAFGYTGNGVGPSWLVGRELARRALGEAPALHLPTRRVPPEPLRIAGAAVLRHALLRKEAIEEAGGVAPAPLRALAGLPARLGMRVVR